MNKSVLLLGGTGLLGQALKRAFDEGSSDFHVTVSGTRDLGERPYLQMDLLKKEDLAKLKEFDVIVNLTGQMTNPMDVCLDLNAKGMDHLLETIEDGAQTLVHISTSLVYGTTEKAEETSPLHPETQYASAKADAESRIGTRLPEDRTLILRLCNLYGPRQAKGLPWFVLDCIKNGKEIVIADNNGELRRTFLHTEDAARMIHDLIVADAHGIVNVAGPENYSIREIVAICERVTGKRIAARYGEAMPSGNIGSIDTSRLERLIPLRPTHTLEEYLRENLA